MKEQMIINKRAMSVLCITAMVLTGCTGFTLSKTPKKEPAEYVVDEFTADEISALAEVTDKLSVWSVYWDCTDDIDTLRDEYENISEVSLFSAYFKDGEIFIPEATGRMLKKIRNKETTKDMKVYLSVVNDVETNGETVQKDTNILKEILSDIGSAKAHAQELVSLAKDNGYDGIEIDYEKIRSDTELWKYFIGFEDILIAEADNAGIGVRIILETSTPVSELEFPEGAEYAVMCYNLYGNGTEPGPKADLDFLKEIYEKFKNVPNISYALSNGGFDWEENSQKPSQVRAADVKELLDKYKVEPVRDENSGAVYFEYTEKNKKHTVWYADDITLKTWTEEINGLSGEKADVGLWRM